MFLNISLTGTDIFLVSISFIASIVASLFVLCLFKPKIKISEKFTISNGKLIFKIQNISYIRKCYETRLYITFVRDDNMKITANIPIEYLCSRKRKRKNKNIDVKNEKVIIAPFPNFDKKICSVTDNNFFKTHKEQVEVMYIIQNRYTSVKHVYPRTYKHNNILENGTFLKGILEPQVPDNSSQEIKMGNDHHN